MNRNATTFSGFLFLVFALGQTVLSAGEPKAEMSVGDLTVEYRTNPLGIDTTAPRFSWRIQSEIRGQKQTAYRVLVASAPEKLANDRGDLWDSGKVSSDQSVLVPYGGTNLAAGTDCYWKVGVWLARHSPGEGGDRNGNPSAWSKPARFSIGLLNPADWKGDWIRYPWSDASKDGHAWFRKTFTLEDGAANALVYVCSIGYHELYVNGEKADDRVLAPAGSRIDRRALYVTYDITGKLGTGENVLAIRHGPGWARFFRVFNMEPALRVQADILGRNGDRRLIISDATWKCHESSSRTVGGGYGGEEIDARKDIAGWDTVGFDEKDWVNAEPVERKVRISAQVVEPDRVIETIKPLKITAAGASNRTYQVDMGRNYTGWLEIRRLRGEPGERIAIYVADDPESREDFGQGSSYICGSEPGTFRNRFNYAGGRFVTIVGLSYEPSLADISGYAISSDLERTGHFRCSHDLLNRIYEMDLWTFRANTVNGVTMDCPHRERLGYGEVTWATAWGCGLPNYRAGAFYTQLVRNWCDVQHANGWLPHVAPQIRTSPWGGTLWSSAPLTTGWEMFRQYGDKRVIEEAYPTYQSWLEFLHSRLSDGILTPYIEDKSKGKFLGDWAAPGGRNEWGNSPEASLFNSCVYALDLKMMIDIAAALDRKDDAALYAGRLDALRKSIHRKFFNPEANSYLAGRQVNLAFPLYVGVVPEALKPAVLANLEREITQTRPYLDMGSSGLPVLLHFLIEDVEWNDILYTHLSKTTLPSYGYFIAKGETTWPEYWEVNVRSKIHTCYTGVASWFIKGIGGIRNDPEQFGYKSFVIKPHLVGDLTFAETSAESLYGKIVSNWTQKDGKVTLHVVVPPNSTATVYVPGLDPEQVTESGKPAGLSEGVQFIRAEKGYLVFRVQSGAYTFVSLQAAGRALHPYGPSTLTTSKVMSSARGARPAKRRMSHWIS